MKGAGMLCSSASASANASVLEEGIRCKIANIENAQTEVEGG